MVGFFGFVRPFPIEVLPLSVQPVTLLAVDDDPTQLELIALAVDELQELSVRLLRAVNLTDAIRLLHQESVHMVLTDQMLPDGTGTDLLLHVQALNPETPTVIITAHESVKEAVELLKLGATDYLVKPIRGREIQHLLLRTFEAVEEQEEQEQMLMSAAGVPELPVHFRSESPQMRSALSIVARAARSSATVLIEGESGVGKEVVARLLHSAGERGDRPLIVVNCAALPETLIESELFGSRKGAYTGATADRTGRFEEANGGTLFLDEIGEVPLATQVKLLRAIQNREFQPVGSNESLRLKARIVAATNRNLEERVRSGAFREDLFYRLRVIYVQIPPLRERKGDIPALIDRFLDRYSRENRKEISALSRSAREALLRHDYPGNVRELENAIEHAVVLCRGQVIQQTDLPEHIRRHSDFQPTPEERDDTGEESKLDRELEVLERRLISSALEEAGGNQSAAARALGISERRLRSRLDRLELK